MTTNLFPLKCLCTLKCRDKHLRGSRDNNIRCNLRCLTTQAANFLENEATWELIAMRLMVKDQVVDIAYSSKDLGQV